MASGSSNEVRALTSEKYVRPALQAGKTRFSVAVKDVIQDLVSRGFPPGNTPQVCSALRKKEFLREHGIEIESIEGPPSKVSTTVVYHYRFSIRPDHAADAGNPANEMPPGPELEDPSARAFRLTERLRGLLKEELAAYGGGEAFLRWIRSEDEDAA